MSAQGTSMIVTGVKFNPSKDVKYSKPKANKSGGKAVNILGSNGTVLHLSTPLMLTWGVSEWIDDNTGKKSYDMSLQFPSDQYPNEAASKFLKPMIDLEEKLKSDAVVNCKEWFNKTKISPEVVDALLTPILKYPKDPHTGEPDKNRAPSLRIKLNYWDDAFTGTEIYDMDKQMIFPNNESSLGPMELITKGTHAAVVIRCGGIWFANGKFGVTWRLVQAVVKPRQSLAGQCHIELSADEKAKLSQQADNSDDDADNINPMAVVDSDDDESQSATFGNTDPEPAPDVEPEPAKKVVKKKVVKKKPTKEAD